METHIKTYSSQQLVALMKELGQTPFRARQLEEWLYVHHVDSYDKMTNLPKALRATLAEAHPLYLPSIVDKRVSKDGTRKYIIEFHDGACVETVAIPSKHDSRLTVCFSTQIGCPMACDFCATGKERFVRNLFPGEIVDQILLAQEDMARRVTNIVGMGQGEPFLNYDNVLAALRIVNNPKGIAIGARHISLSTCGVLPGIQRLSSEPEQFTLAVSLHSAVQETRDRLMPKVACFPLRDLRREIQSYVKATKRRVTFEYIMIRTVNDQPDDLQALMRFCKGLLCHVNLIPINAIAASPYQPSSPAVVKRWVSELSNAGIETTVRDSRGGDIAGACGQLKQTRAMQQ